MTSKEYYRNYLADDVMNPLNLKLVELIKNEKPEWVIEFGCGIGKHLWALEEAGFETLGFDISQTNIDECRKRKPHQNIICSDEKILRSIADSDIIFTCSVLCHIPDVSEIIEQFKRIAKKKIIIAETQETPSEFYYYHDYEALGFTFTGHEFISPGNNCLYKIWEMETV